MLNSSTPRGDLGDAACGCQDSPAKLTRQQKKLLEQLRDTLPVDHRTPRMRAVREGQRLLHVGPGRAARSKLRAAVRQSPAGETRSSVI